MKTNRNQQPKEVGKVSWFRNYEEAMAESKLTKKPIFLFFQEVPGCSTCVYFGLNLLSYPLFVEAIENEFIPLAIYNNVGGDDKKVLAMYNEQAWNNPVVRFIDNSGLDLVPKLENSINPFTLYEKIIEVILITKRFVPQYIELLGGELKILLGSSHVTYYETPCFWSGETSMIQHPMVLSTEAGWISGNEVVKVHFDPEHGSLDELNNYALDQSFYLINNDDSYIKDINPQYYLKGSIFALLPLSFTQRSVLNYVIPYKKDGEGENYLSPLQHRLLQIHRKNGRSRQEVELYDYNIEEIWPF